MIEPLIDHKKYFETGSKAIAEDVQSIDENSLLYDLFLNMNRGTTEYANYAEAVESGQWLQRVCL